MGSRSIRYVESAKTIYDDAVKEIEKVMAEIGAAQTRTGDAPSKDTGDINDVIDDSDSPA